MVLGGVDRGGGNRFGGWAKSAAVNWRICGAKGRVCVEVASVRRTGPRAGAAAGAEVGGLEGSG